MGAVLAASAAARPTPIVERLYPGTAPGSEDWTQPEAVLDSPTGKVIRNVRDPEITAYLPDPATANGAAVILLPGGALRVLAVTREIDEVVARLNERGVAAIVLKYRLAQADPSAPPTARPSPGGPPPAFLKKLEIRHANANPDPSNIQLNTVERLAVADAQEALRRVRSHAAEWKVDPARVGMMGWSAGGGVAMGAVVENAPGAAPDFVISLYGPSLRDVVAPERAPPLFLATETTHGPVTDGLVALYELWHEAGKSAELHLYDIPNFSIRVDHWGDRAFEWMAERKIIPAATQ
jgi:dienelactone hydrolase